MELAREELASDPVSGRQRLTAAGGILRTDFSPSMPLGFVTAKDVYGLPLEALIRSLALRRDFNGMFPQDRFWAMPVQTIETLAAQAMDSGGTVDEASRVAFTTRIDAQIDQLVAATRAAAEKKQLDVQVSRDPARGYKVKIVIRPPTARVRYMQFLTYKECQIVPQSSEARETCMRDQWNDLNEGTLSLIGRYRYWALWGKDLGGDEESNFTIMSDSTVTLHPPRIGNGNGK